MQCFWPFLRLYFFIHFGIANRILKPKYKKALIYFQLLYCGFSIFLSKQYKRDFFLHKGGQYGCRKNPEFFCWFQIWRIISEKVHRKKWDPTNFFFLRLWTFLKNTFLKFSFFGAFFLQFSCMSEISIKFWIFWCPDWPILRRKK